MSTEKSEECDCCGYQTEALTMYVQGYNPVVESWLCDLCAGTPAGQTIPYPRQYEGEASMLRTICYVGNAIIAAIKDMK